MTELEALRLARVPLLTRIVQLSSCRVCAGEVQQKQDALAIIDQMIKERENVQLGQKES